MFLSGWRHWLKSISASSRRARRDRRPARPHAEALEARLAPATFIWDGGGANARWSTRENWVGDVAPNPLGTTVGNQVIYDDLVFPAGAARLNNLNDFRGATFSSVTVSGNGYVLDAGTSPTENAITLGSATGAGYLTTNTGSNTTRVTFNIQLGGSAGSLQSFTVGGPGAALELSGRLSSNSGVALAKDGPGTLIFTNDNSGFSGGISVIAGSLRATHRLALGTTATPTTVFTNAQLQVQNVAGTILEPLTLNGPGTAADGALLNVAGNNTWAGPITLDSSATLGATAGSLTLTGQISDLGSGHDITKEGAGTVILDPLGTADGNTYRGKTFVNNGILTVRHSLALGAGGTAANDTVVNNRTDKKGTLRIENSLNAARVDPGRTVAGDGFVVSSELLTLNGAGVDGLVGALSNFTGNNVWQGNITLASPAPNGVAVSLGVEASTTLTVDGVIRDGPTALAFTKVRPGKLILTSANTYAGRTTVAEGIINVRDSRALGATGEGTVVANQAALELEVDNKTDSVTATTNTLTISEPLSINGRGAPGGGPLGTGALRSISGINQYVANIALAGTEAAIGIDPDPSPEPNANYFTDDWSLTVTSQINGGNATVFAKVGFGHMILTAANPYTGVTQIERGWVTIRNNSALGALIPGRGDTAQPRTTVRDGAALHLRPIDTTSTLNILENLTLWGTGITHPYATINRQGALMNLGGKNVVGGLTNSAGNISLIGPTGIGVETISPFTESELTLTGSIDELPPIINVSRTASGGEAEDRFAVDTGFNTGTIIVNYDFFGVPDFLRIYYDGVRIFDTGVISGSGTINQRFGPGASTIVEIIMNEGSPPNPGTAWTYDLAIQADAGAGGLIKYGSKRLYVQGDGTYNGDVDVVAGVLRVQNDTALGTAGGTTTVRTGAALEIERGLTQINGGIAAGLQVGRGERLVLNGGGNDTADPGQHINTLAILSDDHSWRGSVTLNTNSVLDIAANSRFTISGAINDGTTAAGFTKVGDGKLVLSGLNTFRGNVNVDRGVLNIQSAQALGTTAGGTTVTSAASLEVQGDIVVAGEPLTLQGGAGVAPNLGITPRWFAQGPGPITNGQTNGRENVAGRVTGIAPDPSDPNVVYISTAGGGAWRTKNGGQTWEPLLDAYTGTPLATIFTGAVAVAPSDATRLYVGTGEGNWLGSTPVPDTIVYYGRGVLRSADSGRSWSLLTNADGSNPLLGRSVTKIAVSPSNPNLVFAAVSDLSTNATAGNAGIWRHDGTNWLNITGVVTANRSVANNDTPPNTPGPDDDWRITFPSTNVTYSDVLFVGNSLFMAIGYNGGATSAVYRSDNPAAALPAWALGDGARNSGGGTGFFPNGASTANRSAGQIKLAGGTGVLYALTELGEVYRSVGGTGRNWEVASTQTAVTVSPYNMMIAADPGNNDVVTIAGVGEPFSRGPLQSTDRGTNFATNLGTATPAPHVDYHAAAYDSQGRLLVGNDGGIWRLDASNPVTWKNFNGNLEITAFVGIAVHPTDPDIAYGGTQDNGSVKYTGDFPWLNIADGDGAYMAVDPLNPNTVYQQFQNNSIRRSDNGGQTFTDISAGLSGGTRFYTPIQLDRVNTSRLLVGRSTVFESLNKGASYINIGPNAGVINFFDIATFQGTVAADATTGRLTDPAFTHLFDRGANSYDPDTIYVALSNGNILVTKDHGLTWVTRNGTGANTLPANSPWTDLVVDPTARDTAYLTRMVFNGKQVFKTTDAGLNWTDLTSSPFSGLPDVPAWSVVVDPRNGDVYVGNDLGVYRLPSGQSAWLRVGTGLPNLQARDLALNTALNTLTVGSHGRSMFQLRLEGPQLQAGQQFGTVRVVSGTSLWTGPVSVTGNDLIVRVEKDSQLTIAGSISSTNPAAKVVKIAEGRLVLAGDNTYGGETEVREGVLAARHPNALGSAAGKTVVFNGAALETQSNVDNEPLELNGDGFTLNGHRTGSLRNVSGFNTYSGPITLKTNATLGVDTGSQLTVTGVIADGGSNFQLTKELTGTLILAGNNTYGGLTRVNLGAVRVRHANALGLPAAGTVVLDGAQLQIEGGITVAAEPLELSGSGIFRTGALFNVADSNTWQGPITLKSLPNFSPPTTPAAEVFFGVANLIDTLTLDTVVAESGGKFALNKVGAGALRLSRANTYTGLTTVSAGGLAVANGGALGGPTSDPTRVVFGAALLLDNAGTVNEALTLNGAGDGRGALFNRFGDNTWAGVITLETASTVGVNDLTTLTLGTTASPSITGAGELTKVGRGTLVLATDNDYTGRTNINVGTVTVRKGRSLGAITANTTVVDGATLRLEAAGLVGDEPLVLNGAGFGNAGALIAVGNESWSGALTLATDTVLSLPAATDLLNLSGAIGDGGNRRGLTKLGAGPLTFSGTTANTYTGPTFLNEGALLLSKTAGVVALAGDVTVGDGLGAANSAVLRLTTANQAAATSRVFVLADGLFDLNNQQQTLLLLLLLSGNVTTGTGANAVLTVGTLDMTGGVLTVDIAGSQFVLNAGATTAPDATGVAPLITGAGTLSLPAGSHTLTVVDDAAVANDLRLEVIVGGAGGLTKAGAGNALLTKANTYTGGTTVNAGTLTVNGTVGAVTLANGVLAGTGTVGALTATGGAVSPGGVPGTLTAAGNSTLNASTEVRLDILQGAANRDVLAVQGNLDLGDALLVPQLGVTPAIGDTWTIVTTTGTLTGRFAQGASFFVGDSKYTLTYNANNVVLTRVRANVAVGLTASANPSVFGEPVTYTAVVTSETGAGDLSGTVTFRFDGVDTVVNVAADGRATFAAPTPLSIGTHSLTVTYSGNANFVGGSAALTQTVTKAATQPVYSVSPTPTIFGQAITLTATVTPRAPGAGTPTGQVTFRVDGTDRAPAVALDANGRASITLTGLDVGVHRADVTYNGDGNFNGFAFFTFPDFLFSISKSGTRTEQVVSSRNPATFGEFVTFSARVAATPPGGGIPTGLVTFLDGGTPIGSALLDAGGVATITTAAYLGGGTHSVTARYDGTGNYDPSDSAGTPLFQIVNRSPSTTAIATSLSPAVFGQPFTITATVGAAAPGSAAGLPRGNVTLLVDGASRSTVPLDAGNQARFTLTNLDAGSHTIITRYDGDANFEVSSAGLTQVVGKSNTTTSLSASLTRTVYGQEVIFRAAVRPVSPGGGTPGGTVTFTANGQPLGNPVPVVNGAATLAWSLLPAGVSTVAAMYDADINFNASSATVTQTVTKADALFTVTPSVTAPSAFGQPVTFTLAVAPRSPGAGLPTGNVVVRFDGTNLPAQTLVNGQVTLTPAALSVGTHRLNLAYEGDNNYNAFAVGTYSDTLFRVAKATTTTAQVTPSRNPITAGESASFATVVRVTAPGAGTPTGTVSFFDGTTLLGTGTIDAQGNASVSPATLFPGGTRTITARYNGDANFEASNAAPATLTVDRSGVTASLALDPSPSPVGQTVAATLTVTGNAPGTALGQPTGAVNFFVDGTQVGSATLNAQGRATLGLTGLTIGTRTIEARYVGDTNFAPAARTTTTTVTRYNVSMGLQSSVNPSAFGQSVTFTASVQSSATGVPRPTGSVTFFVDGVRQGGAVTIDALGFANFTTSTLAGGSRLIRAEYSGDPTYNGGAFATVTQAVSRIGSTTTVTSATPNPSAFGQSVTLTATAAAGSPTALTPTGTVTFLEGTTILGQGTLNAQGVAQMVTAALTGGTHTITARYEGDANFATSTSATGLLVTVNKATAAISAITSNLNPSTFGQTVQLTTTVSSGAGTPTGTVTYRDGATVLGTATLDATGRAVLTTASIPVGARTIVATYDGDTNFNGNLASAAFTQTVNRTASTTTLSSLANPSVFGQAAVVAQVASAAGGGTATGTVTFTIDGTRTVGPVTLDANGRATLPAASLTPGTYSVTAAYGGDANLDTSTATALSQVVNKAGTTTSITSSASPSAPGQAVTFTAAVAVVAPGAGAPGGTVTFSIDGTAQPPAALDASGRATLTTSTLPAGAHTIAATYNGDGNFNASTATPFNHSVTAVNSTTSLTTSAGPVPFGTAVTLTATVAASGAGTPTGTVTFFDGATALGTANLAGTTATLQTTTIAVGTRSLTARYNGSAAVNPSTSAAVSFQVTRATPAMTLVSSSAAAVTGRNVTFTATVTAPGGGGTASGTVRFFDGQTALGTAVLVNNRASLTTSFATAGTREIRATYDGDANLNSASAGPVSLAVGSLNQAWVAQVYRDLLRRAVDAGGLAYWSGQLDAGLPADQIVRLLQNSSEYRTIQVDDVYRQLLGRPADAGALSFWVPYLQTGRNVNELRAQLLGSAEYFALSGGTNETFLNRLYQDVLGRPIDQAGLQFNLFLLQQFTPRSAVALNILRSAEGSERLVQSIYQSVLRRAADAAGLAFFRDFLVNGGREEEIIAALMGSQEYFGRL